MARSAFRNRLWLYASIAAQLLIAGAISSASVTDSNGMLLRVGMVLITAGAALWLPLPAAIGVIPAVWFGPNFIRSQISGQFAFETQTWLQLPGLLFLALAAAVTRRQLTLIEQDKERARLYTGGDSEVDAATGVYREELLGDSIERELARSQRFGRQFALMLTGVDGMRARFDYREDERWNEALKATAGVLLNTRHHIDRVHRYGDRGFALLLPETGPGQVVGLIRRLARNARKAKPPEGEAGGPLPLHFGVTFFPQCATTVSDLMRRAEVALRLADKNPSRLQVDGAEAADLPDPELMRKPEDEGAPPAQVAPLASEAPEEVQARAPRPGALEEASPGAAEPFVMAPTVGEAPVEDDVDGLREWLLRQGFADLALSIPASTDSQAPTPPPDSPETPTESGDASLHQLLERLDETRALIRSMKTDSDEHAA